MTISNLLRIILTRVRAVITGYYKWRAAEISRETERPLDYYVRPMVQPSVLFSQDVMYASFKSIGSKPALNVEVNIRHPKFEFDGPLPETALDMGQEVKLNISATDGEPRSQKGFELITKYQDIRGKWFYSRLTQDKHGQHHLEYGGLEKKEDDPRSH